MNRFRTTILFVLTAFLLLLVGSSTAAAYTVAGLHVDFDDSIEPRLQDELNTELVGLFDESRRYDWLAPEDGIEGLDSELQGCFETDCLREISEALDADVGLVVELDVESEVYTWTIEFYDLFEGKSMTLEEGTCELCGRAEVVSQFRTSMQANLALLNLDREHPSGPIDTEVDTDEGHTEVRITTIPSDTHIFLDETPIGEGEATVDLDEGTYEVRFSHDTHHGLRETLIITEDSAPLFILRVHLRGAGGAERKVITRGDGVVDRIEPHRNTIGWTAVGVGAGLTLASFFMAGLHGRPACGGDVEARRCPDIYRTAGISTVTTIIGTVSLAGGVALLTWPLLAGDQNEPTEVGVDVAPTVGREFTGISLFGRF